MVNCYIEKEVNTPIDKVWDILSDFGNLSWMETKPDVEVIGEGVGMIRRIRMPDMEQPIDEKLDSMDSLDMSYSYSITPNPVVPFKNYVAEVKLSETANGGTIVIWSSNFDVALEGAEQAQSMMEGMYLMMVDWLANYAKSNQ